MSGCWTEEEPGWAEFRRDVVWAFRRARSRWSLIVVVSLGIAGAAVAFRVWRPGQHRASIVFRVTEGRLDSRAAPPTSDYLKDQIWNVSLSGSRLRGVAQEFGLYASRLRTDPAWAAEGFRDDLDVEVVRNFFSEPRSAEDPPRSAQVILTYRAENVLLAYDVARRLGQIVVEQQAQSRKAASAAGSESVRESALRMQERLDTAQAEQTRLNLALVSASPQESAWIRVQLAQGTAALPALQAEAGSARSLSGDFALRSAYEGSDKGLRFELLDPGRPSPSGLGRPAYLALVGAAVLVLALPLVALGAGVFDTRIRDASDVRRLGLALFGRLPRGGAK